jgi:hypothetical protein
MTKTLGMTVTAAIADVKKALDVMNGERDYAYAKRFAAALEVKLGLKLLVMTDSGSCDARPRLNIIVWSEAGREIKNPELRGSRRCNYFYG